MIRRLSLFFVIFLLGTCLLFRLKPEKNVLAKESFKGKLMTFENLGFRIVVPEKNWVIQENQDESMPVELILQNSSLIQIMTFLKTMTTVPEIEKQLNSIYEKKFLADGANNYTIGKEKEFRFQSITGKRVMAQFNKESENYALDQIYIDGPERIYVFLLTSKKSKYDAVKNDFEMLVKSFKLTDIKGELR